MTNRPRTSSTAGTAGSSRRSRPERDRGPRLDPTRGLGHDLRLALRNLRRRPAVTAVVVVTLGLGIAANGILFASLYGSAVRPLPFREPERLVALNAARAELGESRHEVSAADLVDWLAGTPAFEEAGAYAWHAFTLREPATGPGVPQSIAGCRITANLFPLLGVEPVLGRQLTAEEDRPGGSRVVLIGHRIWTERFGADPRILGRSLRLDGVPHEIVGVMPEGFAFSHTQELWTPLQLDRDATPRDRRDLSVVARLGPEAGLDQAQLELDAVAERLEALHPATNEGWGVVARPLRNAWLPVPPGGRVALVAQVAMVILVLAIVCANVTNVLLAQAETRRRERALRAALGASRGRLIRQTMVESMLLGLAGGAVGTALASGSAVWLEQIVPFELPYFLDLGLEAHGLVYVLAVTVLAGVLVGLLPALSSAGRDLFGDLGGGPQAPSGRGRLQRALVVGEYAVAVVVLVAGLLMVRSFQKLQREDRGFAVEGVLTLRLPLSATGAEDDRERSAFVAEAERRLAALPDVVAVGAANELPITLEASSSTVRVFADRTTVTDGDEPRALRYAVTEGYFEALSIPRRAGRAFTPDELVGGAPRVVISEGLAEALWPGQDPLQRRIRLSEASTSSNPEAGGWVEVVGVVADIEPAQSMVGFGDMPRHRLYLPFGGGDDRPVPATPTLVVATRHDPESAIPTVRRALAELSPSLPLIEVEPMARVLHRFHFVQHFWSRLFSAIALLALSIAGIGVYGVTSHSVSRRLREMAVRGALGARPRDLLVRVLGQGVATAAVGVAVGAAGAVPLARSMEVILHEMPGLDPVVFASVSGGLLAVGLLASWLPARRAAACAPVDVLREI